MQDILIGTTDRTVLVFIPDPASTTGAGKTGLNAAALTVTYTRVETDNDVVHTDVTSSLNDLSALTDAHNDWGLKEVSSTLSKGLYRLDIADAVFASGAWQAVVQVTITSGTAAATPMSFLLVAFNPLDGVRLGLTALPNAAANAAGGLPISTAGALDLDDLKADINTINTNIGTPSDLGGGATVAANLVVIEGQTDDIGVAGLGLSAVPWNAAWDAEAQSEVADALAVYDPPTNAEMEARTLVAANYATASALDAVDNFIDTEIGTIITAIAALPTVTTIWTTALTEAYATDGAAFTGAQALYEICQFLQEKSFSGTTGTIKKRDGTSSAYTLTINDASTPTSITRAT